MKLTKTVKTNFGTLQRAFNNGDACLLDCREKSTGKEVQAICTCSYDGSEYELTPFAIMIDGNPFEILEPPNASGGYEVTE